MASKSLNSLAPEFFPNPLHKQQSPTPPIISLPHHHHRYHHFTFYSFRQPNPFLYYPTLSTTLPLSPSEAKTAHVETQDQQQVMTREKTSGSKRVMKQKKKVFKILNCEETVSRGPRFFSNRLRFQAFEWRKKEPKEEPKECVNVIRETECFYGPFIKNRQNVVGGEQKKNFRASSSFFQKRAFPVVPVSQDGEETTVMIKNIPSKYTRELLVEFLENHCMTVNEESREENSFLAFDFVYLPIDFRTGMNKGYAFVNFTKPKAAWKFLVTTSDRKWELFHSDKIRQVVLARIQGEEKLESHFKTMNFPYDYEDVLPLSFNPPRDGVIKGDQKTLGRLLKGTNQL